MTLRVRSLDRAEHLAFVRKRAEAGPDVSYLQTPAWGEVKADWGAESIGWTDSSGALVGAGEVLYRKVPRLGRSLAYLPQGPVVDWFGEHDVHAWLDPMLAYLKKQGAFSVKIGPQVPVRRWHAETVKQAIADGTAKRLRDVPPDVEEADALRLADALRTAGWQQDAGADGGFGDFQPRYVFQVPVAGRTEAEVLAGCNQLWRRNIRKAEKAGVLVEVGSEADLPTFHELYLATASHQHFTPRPLSYFERMYRTLRAEDGDRIRLYLGRHEGEVLAANLMMGMGRHVWYSYGGTALHKRELRASNAVQWRMLTDAMAAGAAVYDLRGIGDALDPDDHLFGLIQFKLGTGGEAVEYLGEWDYPLNRLLHKAMNVYMSRR
jgi:lipid II:glycine glycyltransferase (peptidoglycan interpeptide bridge formation enzyme)